MKKLYNLKTLNEAHKDFLEDGVVFFSKIIPESIFLEAESKINEVVSSGLPTKDLVNLHNSVPWFRDFVLREEFIKVAISLLGSSTVKVFSSMILNKPPHGEMPVPWHQDAAYDWPIDPVDCASLWLAFDDITIENGAMEVALKAHNKGAFRMQESKKLRESEHHFSSELVRSIPDGSLKIFEKVYLTMKKGFSTFHHSMTPHRSSPNLTETRRCAFIVRYCPGEIKLVKFPGMKREKDFIDLDFLEANSK